MGISIISVNAESEREVILPQVLQTQELSVPQFLWGEVTAEVLIDERGNLKKVKDINGDVFLKPYAEKLLTEKLVFTPTIKNGEPIVSTIRIPLIFQ